MENEFRSRRSKFTDLLSIKSHSDFHSYLLCEALDKYKSYRAKEGMPLGRILAVCANIREAIVLQKYGFDEILLTGLVEPSDELVKEIKKDSRISYCQENSESLRIPSKSFDLVICKEGIHHLARPILGVYEMLRVSRSGVIIIEPGSTLIGSLLAVARLSSVYEKNQEDNISCRDNYVYRWNMRNLKDLLKSYYLESGFTVDVTQGWLSSSVNCHSNYFVRLMAALIGWLASFTPGSRGNCFSALIFIGKDIPEDVAPLID